jgi:hypothetical protein
MIAEKFGSGKFFCRVEGMIEEIPFKCWLKHVYFMI